MGCFVLFWGGGDGLIFRLSHEVCKKITRIFTPSHLAHSRHSVHCVEYGSGVGQSNALGHILPRAVPSVRALDQYVWPLRQSLVCPGPSQ